MVLVDWPIGSFSHSLNVIAFCRTGLSLGNTHKIFEWHGGRKHNTPALFKERTFEEICSVPIDVFLRRLDHCGDISQPLDSDRIWYLHHVTPLSLEGSWSGRPRDAG